MRTSVLYTVMVWVLFITSIVWIIIAEYLGAKRDEAMIRAAQNLELEEGVTLLQAVRAYYGEDGLWGVAQGKVYAFAGRSSSRRGDVRVNLETGEVMLYRDGYEGDKAESAALVEAMVLAVKKGERGPWP